MALFVSSNELSSILDGRLQFCKFRRFKQVLLRHWDDLVSALAMDGSVVSGVRIDIHLPNEVRIRLSSGLTGLRYLGLDSGVPWALARTCGI